MPSLRLKYLVPDYEELLDLEKTVLPLLKLRYMVPDYAEIKRRLARAKKNGRDLEDESK